MHNNEYNHDVSSYDTNRLNLFRRIFGKMLLLSPSILSTARLDWVVAGMTISCGGNLFKPDKMNILIKITTILLSISVFSLLIIVKSTPYRELLVSPNLNKPKLVILKKFDHLDPDSIFFLDTSTDNYLSDMTLCAIESAARVNVDQKIVLLRVYGNLYLNPQLRRLKTSLPQVDFQRVHLDELMNRAGFLKLNELSFQTSVWPVFHISDVLRVALLKLYGGTYLDSDAVSIRPLPKDRNFVVIETSESIANGLLRFRLGHPVIEEALHYLDNNFDPKGWANNGPLVFTKAIQKLCQIPESTHLSSIKADKCLGIHGYSNDKFLLIGTKQFWEFVESHTQDWIDQKIEELEAKSLSTHLWGHRYKMHNLKFDFKSFNASQLIYHIGQKYCPTTFLSSRERSE